MNKYVVRLTPLNFLFITVDVLNHFHLVRKKDVQFLFGDKTVPKQKAREDFLRDINALLNDESTFNTTGELLQIKEIDAEKAYHTEEGKQKYSVIVGIKGFTF